MDKHQEFQRAKEGFFQRNEVLRKKTGKLSISVTVVYLIIGFLWIAFSDQAVDQMLRGTPYLTMAQTLKGWFYVGVTGVLLYWFIKRNTNAMKTLYEKLTANYEELETLHGELILTEEALEDKYKTLEENQENLRILQERYQLALEGSKDGLWDWNVKTDRFLVTKLRELLGYEDAEKIHSRKDWLNLIHPGDAQRVQKVLNQYLEGQRDHYETEYRIQNRKGEYIWILSKAKAIWDSNGRPIRVCGSHTNITEEKIKEEKIQTMAYYDSTTKIPNRFWLGEYLEEQIKLIMDNEEKMAILLIDLDNFKKVNEILTHEMGDRFLMEIAKKIQENLEGGEILTRFGGDEFVVVITGNPDRNRVNATANRLLNTLKKKSTVKGYQFNITGSIGIAICPEHGQDKDTLLKNADAAMYEAKNNGRDRMRFYSREVNEKIRENIILESDLRKALENNEFMIQIQPLIEVKTGRIVGGEALLRWNHPRKGRISPGEFIAVAEETGIIVPIGEKVLKEVCGFYQNLFHRGINPVPISVNLAVPQILHSGLLDSIQEFMEASVFPKPLLEIEITESVIMNNLDYAVKIMKSIRGMGVKVALDDFGTGYSSLSYLKNLPIDKLKIDKSFIDDIVENDSEQTIVKSVIEMAKSLKIQTVAEGIEKKEQWDILKKYDCDVGQGYYMYRPMDVEDFQGILRTQQANEP